MKNAPQLNIMKIYSAEKSRPIIKNLENNGKRYTYEQDFLIEKMLDDIRYRIIQEAKPSFVYTEADGGMKSYLENRKETYPDTKYNYEQQGHFPEPDHFFHNQDMYRYGDTKELYVNFDDETFPLYFALKLINTDLLVLDDELTKLGQLFFENPRKYKR